MDIFTEILALLTKLEKSLKCPLCEEKCVEPVRIKTCGHYFCSVCLKSLKVCHNCPVCKEYYEVRHLDYENVHHNESEKQLVELRGLLESAVPYNNREKHLKTVLKKITVSKDSNSTGSKNHNNAPKAVCVSSENSILHNHNKYHVNFINSPMKKNAKGETPLHLACKRKKFAEVKSLIQLKVDINAKDYAGWAPLHEAVQSKSLEIIEFLLQNHCLIDIPGPDYVTPLHQAASLENVDMVKLILKHGADKNMVDYTGLKPEDSTKNKALKEVLKVDFARSSQSKLFEVFVPGKVCLYCHSIDEVFKKKLEECKNIQVVDKMDMKKNLTHFVVKKNHTLSFKILQAMLEGLQFFNEDSVDDYVKGNYFINIPEHVFLTDKDLNKGIRKAMLSTLLRLPKLFDGINFYIEDHTTPVDVYRLKVDKDYLTKLIKAGGGRVLHRPPATRTCETEYTHPFFCQPESGTYRCCNFILYAGNRPPDLLYNMDELKHKSSRWLIDCVVRYEIFD